MYCQGSLGRAIWVLISSPVWLLVIGAILCNSLQSSVLSVHDCLTPHVDRGSTVEIRMILFFIQRDFLLRSLHVFYKCVMFWNVILLQGYRSAKNSFKPGYPFLGPLEPCLLILITLITELFRSCCSWACSSRIDWMDFEAVASISRIVILSNGFQ